MSYAAVEDLAAALEIRVTTENTQLLQDCLDAAWTELQQTLADCVYVDPSPLVKRVNVNRAVEWFKAPATYNGGVGTVDTGVLTPPSTGMDKHALALTPIRVQWGVA